LKARNCLQAGSAAVVPFKFYLPLLSQSGRVDLDVSVPNRQTTSIFKQPVTRKTNHKANKVKVDPARSVGKPPQQVPVWIAWFYISVLFFTVALEVALNQQHLSGGYCCSSDFAKSQLRIFLSCVLLSEQDVIRVLCKRVSALTGLVVVIYSMCFCSCFGKSA